MKKPQNRGLQPQRCSVETLPWIRIVRHDYDAAGKSANPPAMNDASYPCGLEEELHSTGRSLKHSRISAVSKAWPCLILQALLKSQPMTFPLPCWPEPPSSTDPQSSGSGSPLLPSFAGLPRPALQMNLFPQGSFLCPYFGVKNISAISVLGIGMGLRSVSWNPQILRFYMDFKGSDGASM